MESLRAKLAVFQESRPGLFLQKMQNDQITNLASQLAWGTLSTMVPLLLGILGIVGLVLRDPQRMEQVTNVLFTLIPSQASGALSDTLESIRTGSAGSASIVGLLLLLFSGSRFFAGMASVFNHAYHVKDRNVLVGTLVSIVMLIVTSVLLLLSTVAFGLGSVAGTLPLGLPFGPVLARVISWSLSILMAVLVFVLIYRILPNRKLSWGQSFPGAIAATVLFFLIIQLFPLYLTFFPPNKAYATFGLFLVLTFWLYLLGIVFVFGAELNAFLEQPARSTALAETTAKARQGEASFNEQSGEVKAEASGDAPLLGGTGERDATGDVPSGSNRAPDEKRPSAAPAPQNKTLAGQFLGFFGLIIAAVILRGRSPKSESPSA